MSDKFQDIYRIPSARAEWWDYRNNAAYFVTICTADREHYFGEIEDEIMQLSEMGKTAYQNWVELPNHFPFVKLDAFVVMPNHVHGILVIDHSKNDANVAVCKDAINRVFTENQLIGGITGQNNPMLSDNLSRIIRWYKGRTTFQSRQIHVDFTWQSRFHDHIIRDKNEYWKIMEYILNNSKRWGEDKYNQPKTP